LEWLARRDEYFSFPFPVGLFPIVERTEKQPICQLARVAFVKSCCDKSAKLLPVIAARAGSLRKRPRRR
jgi:hypothetical protein